MVRRSVSTPVVLFAAVVVVAVVIVGVLALGLVPSTTQTSTSSQSASATQGKGETFDVQVVNSPDMTPSAGTSVEAGPATSAIDVAYTPGGPTLTQCVEQVPSGATVSSGEVVSNGTTITFPSCPLTTYTTNATGWVSIPDATGSYYFIKAGSVNENNDILLGVEANTTMKLTIPLPSGNITTVVGETCVQGNGSNVTSTCSSARLPVLWPHTTIVWPCGQGLPSGSAVTSQGPYGGYYIAFAYAALSNGTDAALPTDCSNLGSSSGPEDMVQVTATLIVPSGSGSGTLTVTVRNDWSGPIASVTIAPDRNSTDTVSGGFAYTSVSGGSTYNSQGPSFPVYVGDLPVGESTAASAQVSGVSAGESYIFVVTADFVGGTSQVQYLTLTAQL